ncbi:hypothetical protein AB4345_08245 [Vibrio breoganii]
MDQKEILSKLTNNEKKLLQEILNIEQGKLYVVDLEKNRSEEKTIVDRIFKLIERSI